MISLISSIPKSWPSGGFDDKSALPLTKGKLFATKAYQFSEILAIPKLLTSYPFWYFIMCCSKLEHRFNNVYVMSCTAARSASSNYRISRNIPCLLFMTHIFFGVCAIFWLNKTLICKLDMMRKLFP